MKINKLVLIVIIALGTILYSCYSHNWDNLHPATQTTTPPTCVIPAVVSYSLDIAPIISQNCSSSALGCHNNSHGSGGLNLSTYTGVSGQAGTPATSCTLYQVISWTGPYTSSGMPQAPNARLTSCQINTILTWVQAGYPNN